MPPVLRDYQRAVVARLVPEIAARRRALLVATTGSGKTVIAGAIVADAARHRQRVLFLAHRRELIVQASRKMHAAGVDHGIIQAGFPMRPAEAVQIASIQTLHARAVRGSKVELPPADIVIVDEAHHARAATYSQIIEAYPNSAVIGLTATPCRGDGRGLGEIFDVLVECPPVAQLIADGHLVGTRVYAPSRPDLTGVRVERGDYAEGQLARRMNDDGLVGDIVEHWLRLADRRKTVVFASGVDHSVNIRDKFRDAGVGAEHIDGSTLMEQRDAILAALASGAVELVTNCMVLTEGWDQPEVSCLVLARPTKNMGLYRQMVGRGLRPAQGKDDCMVLDHAGAVFEHGFVEDEVIWTLDRDTQADNPEHRRRTGRKALAACPECFAIRAVGAACRVCGWKPPVPAFAAGKLAPVISNGDAKSDPKLTLYRQLLWIAHERSYKRGWAAHKYREKFGDWPATRFAEPLEPDAKVRNWVQGKMRAHAKSLGGRASR